MLSLSSLLDVDAFTLREHVWDRVPRVARGTGHGVRERFGAESLKAAIREGQLPANQVVVKGFVGPVDVADGTGRVEGSTAVQRVWEEGHALIVNGAHSILGGVGSMAAELGGGVGCPVRANVYRTALGTFAYPTHWDTHGLVAVQLAGAKRWELFAPVFERPIEGQTLGTVEAPPIDRSRPAMVVELVAGDVLYVPRGWGHRVVTTGAQSVHLTFGFYPETELDGLRQAMAVVQEQLALELDFRGELGSEADGLEQRAAAMVARVFSALRQKSQRPLKQVG